MRKHPSIPQVGIIALVYHDWSWRWLTPHHVLTRLAEYFHVVWVNPAHGWHEIPKRLKARASDAERNNGFAAGFNTYYPELWLPIFYRPKWLAKFTLQQRLQRARKILKNKGCEKIILHLWHYEFAEALQAIPHDLSCYHLDDEYSFSNVEIPVSEQEAKVIAAVDQVFAISPGLMEKKGKHNPHAAFVPEGVDYHAYADRALEPADLATISPPRLGYTGMLKKHLDWPLLFDLAQKHQAWSFVFVGPLNRTHGIEQEIAKLAGLANVHFLGEKTVHELARYPQHFDVCMMPYVVSDYTKYIYPLKLHEYLASGRPVVGSPIRSLQDFSHVIRLADTGDKWSAALAAALASSEKSPSSMAARQSVAQAHDWENLIRKIARIQCERLSVNGVNFFETSAI